MRIMLSFLAIDLEFISKNNLLITVLGILAVESLMVLIFFRGFM